ncbi:MAG TPA: hypothetical protein VGL99_30655 [Chloroflexota bacterium]
MTFATFLQPAWLVVLVVWHFAVLAAAQLTIRLIMAFSVRATLLAALVLTVASLAGAFAYDLAIGQQPSLTTRLAWLPLAMAIEGVAGYAIARWVLKFKRHRGQVITGLMVAVLAPHTFALLSSV